MILGGAMGWGHLKGLDVFVELARRLPRDEYTVVLVGTDDATEKQLPEGVISIRRTESIKELAEIYTAADLFVNPTRQDTYPTVNLEAIACGTPVLTFRTGGSPEMINDKMGRVVERDDIEALISEIELMTGSDAPLFDRDVLVKEAEAYDASLRFNQYVDLYEQ
jgi:glycosyltransferase involved in cell wall biosynthesis